MEIAPWEEIKQSESYLYAYFICIQLELDSILEVKLETLSMINGWKLDPN